MNLDKDLDFATHLQFYSALMGGVSEVDEYFLFEAQQMHALSVMQALLDTYPMLPDIGDRLGMGRVYHHIVFGAARRLNFILSAFRQLCSIVPPNRKTTMKLEEVHDSGRALNDIYIHTRGVLDNYAWAFGFLFGGAEFEKLPQNRVGLFSKHMKSLFADCGAQDIISAFSDWDRELKDRRDPVAHRIPLSVPPAILDTEAAAQRAKLNEQYIYAQKKAFSFVRERAPQNKIEASFDEVKRISSKMQEVGTFHPWIVHDPNERLTPIYPTVPSDIGQLVRLVRRLNSIIERQIPPQQG